ncbi:kyphoscoliosis peptidase-like [Glandiceps talaboti]
MGCGSSLRQSFSGSTLHSPRNKSENNGITIGASQINGNVQNNVSQGCHISKHITETSKSLTVPENGQYLHDSPPRGNASSRNTTTDCTRQCLLGDDGENHGDSLEHSQSPSMDTFLLNFRKDQNNNSTKEVDRCYKKPIYLKTEDTFCAGKQQLIPDYTVMKRIDMHAFNTPTHLKDNHEQLVGYLIQHCANDLEKVRVIFRWVLENVRYDRLNFERGTTHLIDTSPEGVIRHGRTNCVGYTKTFAYLCKLADIECNYVSGACKAFAANYRPGFEFPIPLIGCRLTHAWNKVKIYDKWYLCDCTWADRECDMNDVTDIRERIEKGMAEDYFLVDPELLLGSHLPIADFTDGVTDVENQMVKQPVCDIQAWSRTMAHGVGRILFKMTLLTEDQAVVKADSDNRAVIRLRSPYPMEFWSNMLDCKGKEDFGSKSVIISVLDCIVTVDIFLPYPGEYRFGLRCRPLYSDEQLQRRFHVIDCIVVGESQKRNIPIDLNGHHHWGQSLEFLEKGFAVVSHRTPIIDVDGRVDIVVALPEKELIKYNLTHVSNQLNPGADNKYVNMDRKEGAVVFNLVLPPNGKFTLDLLIKSGEDGTWRQAAGYLVRCL